METKEMVESKPMFKNPVAVGNSGIVLNNIEDMFRFARAVVKSGLAPKSMPSEEAVFIAMQLGFELGITPMSAIQNIAVINGRPGIWGDLQLALVQSSGKMEKYTQVYAGSGDTRTCTVTVKRFGQSEIVQTFGWADAKRAGLDKKDTYQNYPDRMIMSRARAFALRDAFPDVLKGVKSIEELNDYPNEKVVVEAKVPVFPQPEPAALAFPQVGLKPGVLNANDVPSPMTTKESANESTRFAAKEVVRELQMTEGFSDEELRTACRKAGILSRSTKIPIDELTLEKFNEIKVAWPAIVAHVKEARLVEQPAQ